MKNFFSNLIKQGISEIDKVFDQIITQIMKPNMELEDLAKEYCKQFGDDIINEEKKKGLTYIGGTFKITYNNENSFLLSSEIYFQSKDKKIIKREIKSNNPQNSKYLTEKAVQELKNKKYIEYDIEEP